LTKYKTKLFDENAAECSVKLSFMTSNDNVQNADDLAISNDKGPGKCSLQHIYRYPTIPSSDITTDKRPRICFGIPSMTRQRIPNISDLPIMKTFLASVFETIKKDSESSFYYSIYLGFDEGDPTYDGPIMAEIYNEFKKRSNSFPIDFHVSRFPPVAGDNVYIWNHLMMQGYVDGCDYLFQLCDDVTLSTPGWSEAYVNFLQSNDPPNVGMIGFPVFTGLISQPFVHRTHIDIFGYFYPHVFKNWYGDTWLCHIYGKRQKDESSFILSNTQVDGVRYSPCHHEPLYNEQVNIAQKTISDYLEARGKSYH